MNEVGSFVVSIKAQVQGYQDQINKIKKALEGVDVSSGIGKSLARTLEQAEKQINALARDTTKRISSESQITGLYDKLGRVNSLIEEMANKLGTVQWGDLTGGLGQALKEAQAAAAQLQQQMSANFTKVLKEAVLNSADLQQVFKDLKIDVDKIGETELSARLTEGIKTLANEAQIAREEVARLAEEKAKLEEQKSNLTKNRDTYFSKTKSDTILKNAGIQSLTAIPKAGTRVIDTSKLADFSAKIKDITDQAVKSDASLTKAAEKVKNYLDALAKSKDVEADLSKINELLKEQFNTNFNKIGVATGPKKAALAVTSSAINTTNEANQQVAKDNADKLTNIAKDLGLDQDTEFMKMIDQLKTATGQKLIDLQDSIINRIKDFREQLIKEAKDLDTKINDITKDINAQTKVATTAENKQARAESVQPIVDSTIQEYRKKYEAELQRSQALEQEVERLNGLINEQNNKPTDQANLGTQLQGEAAAAWENLHQLEEGYMQRLDQARAKEKLLGNFEQFIQRWFSVYAVSNMVRNVFNSITGTLKELDDVMTEIAIVTDMTQENLWDQMSDYTEMARQYAVSIKGVYEVSQLFYQQG